MVAIFENAHHSFKHFNGTYENHRPPPCGGQWRGLIMDTIEIRIKFGKDVSGDTKKQFLDQMALNVQKYEDVLFKGDPYQVEVVGEV